jgi:hypothetical protein
MPIPGTPGPGSFGLLGSASAVLGPIGMMIAAFLRPGPVKTLLRAHADCPDRARQPHTLGLALPPLEPLVRSGVLIREPNGCVWVDRAMAKRRQRRLTWTFGAIGLALGLIVWGLLSI